MPRVPPRASVPRLSLPNKQVGLAIVQHHHQCYMQACYAPEARADGGDDGADSDKIAHSRAHGLPSRYRHNEWSHCMPTSSTACGTRATRSTRLIWTPALPPRRRWYVSRVLLPQQCGLRARRSSTAVSISLPHGRRVRDVSGAVGRQHARCCSYHARCQPRLEQQLH